MEEYTISGKQVNVCPIGTWSWGAGLNGSKMIFGQRFSEEHLREVFDRCWELGFHFWDTAEVYGMGTAETLLGKFLAGREGAILSTKHMPKRFFHPGEDRAALEGSLRRLNVPAIDLYWLHRPDHLERNMEELGQCLREGLIRAVGLSNCGVSQLRRADKVLERYGGRVSAVQNHYSLLTIERERETLAYCKENGVLFFGYMLLEQGALSGHYDARRPFERFSLRGLSFGRGKLRKIEPLIEAIRAMGKTHQVDPSQIPIAWGLAQGVIPIVGINKAPHALDLRQGLEVVLTPEELRELEDLALRSGVVRKGIWE